VTAALICVASSSVQPETPKTERGRVCGKASELNQAVQAVQRIRRPNFNLQPLPAFSHLNLYPASHHTQHSLDTRTLSYSLTRYSLKSYQLLPSWRCWLLSLPSPFTIFNLASPNFSSTRRRASPSSFCTILPLRICFGNLPA
jgi:hypothetical protein